METAAQFSLDCDDTLADSIMCVRVRVWFRVHVCACAYVCVHVSLSLSLFVCSCLCPAVQSDWRWRGPSETHRTTTRHKIFRCGKQARARGQSKAKIKAGRGGRKQLVACTHRTRHRVLQSVEDVCEALNSMTLSLQPAVQRQHEVSAVKETTREERRESSKRPLVDPHLPCTQHQNRLSHVCVCVCVCVRVCERASS